MMKNFLVAFVLLLIADPLFANTLWSSRGNTPPRHRNMTNEASAPCGVGERSPSSELKAGESIELQWEEVISQEGYFEIYFSPADDSNWVLLKKINNPVQQGSSGVVLHSTEVDVPLVNCENCTLQVIQTITGNVEAKYYSCSDIKVTGDLNKVNTSAVEDDCPE